MKLSTETTKYAQMGMAALLPGMTYMLERMQHEIDDMRAMLERLQNGEAAPAKRHSSGPWADMTAEERSAEMKRRQKVAKANGYAEARRKRWAKMTKKQRAEWQAKMAAGRRRAAGKRRVNGAIAAAEKGLVNGRAAA